MQSSTAKKSLKLSAAPPPAAPRSLRAMKVDNLSNFLEINFFFSEVAL